MPMSVREEHRFYQAVESDLSTMLLNLFYTNKVRYLATFFTKFI
jgi:hypothetical protein